MKLYLLFLLTATVFSPGPGVVMTLTNALRYGVRGTFGGILGIGFDALPRSSSPTVGPRSQFQQGQ